MSEVYKMKTIVFFCTLWYVCSGTWTPLRFPGLLGASSHSSALIFSIISRRNVTGHWVAEVQLEHDVEHNDTGPWRVDVKHISTKHEDTSESILILANITAPPQRQNPDYELFPPQRQNPDYELFPGLGYYKFHTNSPTWFDAQNTCVQEGAHLVILNSELEARTVGTMIERYPKTFGDWRDDWSYIGANDLQVNGEFVTIFNQPISETGYMKWYPKQPNGGNCLVMYRGVGMLGDVACLDEISFVCEKEL